MALTAKTERDNFCRFGQGIVGTGTSMSRDVLTSYILPVDLSIKVRPGHLVWSSLDKQQKDLVKNAAKDGYIKFDITLTYKLLRNVCSHLNDPSKSDLPAPTQGWGKAPKIGDISLSDDLERLRILRNTVYGHVSNPSLPEAEYQTYWQELKGIAHRMKNHLTKDYLTELQELEVYKMSDAEIKDLIKEIKVHSNDVKNNVERIEKLEKQHNDIYTQHEALHQEVLTHESRITTLRKTTDDHGQQIQNLRKTIQEKQEYLSEKNTPKYSTKRSMGIRELINNLVGREPDLSKLKKKVYDINNFETNMLPVAPLQHAGKVPIDLLYASVVIQENKKYTNRGNSLGMIHFPLKKEIEVTSPRELFYIDGKLVRRVYMVGNAAHGKTTYCLWLLRHWCKFQNVGSNRSPLNKWEMCLGQFDFVFFIKLRYMDPWRVSLIQMIQQIVTEDDPSLNEALDYVLGSEKYPCLIILDGLDEWNARRDTLDQLRYKGMPNVGNLVNCVIFTTMRHWRLESVMETLTENDKIVEIQGLDTHGFRTVTEKMLVNHYGMEKKSEEFEEKFNEIIHKAKDETMKSFMKIPLLAVVCVQLWVKGKQVNASMTSFYAAMVDMLIERASMAHETQCLEDKTLPHDIPIVLRENINIQCFLSILLKLGKIAYEGLLADETTLFFRKKKLEMEVGRKELQFALNVGLISQQEAPSITTRNISVHFFHKSVQEFLAALYIVREKEVDKDFCKHLSNLSLMKELSNVTMFICGLYPVLGCHLSKHLVSPITDDRIIAFCRKWLNSLWKQNMEMIYDMQVSWYKEIKHARAFTDDKLIFYVSDVYVDIVCQDSVKEFVMDHHVNINRMILTGCLGMDIANNIMNNFMANSRSLVSLYVDGEQVYRSLHVVNIPTIEHLQLFNVIIESDETPFLSNLTSLRTIKLSGIELGERPLGFSPDMINLAEVILHDVIMSDKA